MRGRMRSGHTHSGTHLMHRIGWLRAAVLGANDGIVSTASLIVGVAAAAESREPILLAGTAGLVAGAMSMATGEYFGGTRALLVEADAWCFREPTKLCTWKNCGATWGNLNSCISGTNWAPNSSNAACELQTSTTLHPVAVGPATCERIPPFGQSFAKPPSVLRVPARPRGFAWRGVRAT